jgi:hypothetical protein
MRGSAVAALPLLLLAAACGSDPKVVVHAEVDGQRVADLPVTLLPYDRQAVLDSLAKAQETPEPLFPVELVQQFRKLEAEENAVRQRGDSAVARWTVQMRQVRTRVDSLRAARKAWTDEAYADFEEAAEERVAASGLSVEVDTTDAGGYSAFRAADGQWWVTARYMLPEAELEWNVPVAATGDSVVVRLTRQNARARPFL